MQWLSNYTNLVSQPTGDETTQLALILITNSHRLGHFSLLYQNTH